MRSFFKHKIFLLGSTAFFVFSLGIALFLVDRSHELRGKAAETTPAISFEEEARKSGLSTENLDITAGVSGTTENIIQTGFWMGRKIKVVANETLPSLFHNSVGISALETMSDGKLFLGTYNAFAIKRAKDVGWNKLTYYDLDKLNLSMTITYFVQTLEKDYDVILGYQSGRTLRLKSDGGLEVIRDPFDPLGYLRGVNVVPYGRGKQILAYRGSELYYYNFETGVVRKWLTPLRPSCGNRDFLGGLKTIKEADGKINTYALIKEPYTTPSCQPQFKYFLYRIIVDDVNPLKTIQLGAIGGELSYLGTFQESFAKPRSDNPSQWILFGKPKFATRLSFIPYFHTDGRPLEIKTFFIEEYKTIYDLSVEKSEDYYTNVWLVAEGVGGLFVGDSFDHSSFSPTLKGTYGSLFANPYLTEVATNLDGTTIIGHRYLSGQFNNGLITLLEKPKGEEIPKGFGQVFWVDGRGFLEVPHQASLETPNEFTVEFRFNYLGEPGGQVLLWKEKENYQASYYFWKLNDNRIAFGLKTNEDDFDHFLPLYTSPIETNRWYHLAAVVKNNKAFLYLDGRLQATASFDGSIVFSSAPLYIGARKGPSFHFSGMIDEVRISKMARYETNFSPLRESFRADAKTVLLFHLEGNAKDSSSNRNHGQPQRVYDFIGRSVPNVLE